MNHVKKTILPYQQGHQFLLRKKKVKTLFQSTIFYFLVYSAYVTFFGFLLISMI
jgi:hypothetical protein